MTNEEIAAVNAEIAQLEKIATSGIGSVTVDGRQTAFRSGDEIRKRIRDLKRKLGTGRKVFNRARLG